MRFGCCGRIDQIAAIRAAGYDYVELRVVDLLPDEDETAYAPIRRQIVDGDLRPEAFNVFVPAHHPVVGPGRDLSALAAYVTTAMERMRALGAELVVFGSGGARQRPPGFDRGQAADQINEFLLLAGAEAERHGLEVVIEPLARKVCNTINTVAEGHAAARRCGHSRVGTLADWWHVCANDEPLASLAEADVGLRHAHVPVPALPGMPPLAVDPGFDAFLRALRATGYDRRISVEDNGKRFGDLATEAALALERVRKGWSAA